MGFSVVQSEVFCVVLLCGSLLVIVFSFGHFIVCSSSNLTAFDYPFGICKLFSNKLDKSNVSERDMIHICAMVSLVLSL